MMRLGFLAAFALLAVAYAQDPVKVFVDYESLCPDSKKFISGQLWPTYQKISEIFIVDFTPFGKENITEDATGAYQFTCQHGPNECYGNKIHSCALNYYPDNVDTVPFISCSMSAGDPVNASESCATQYGLDWPTIYDCANSDLGSQLLHDNGIITQSLSPPLTYVPWIIINDVYTDQNEVLAQVDFFRLVCDTYQGTPPDECLA